MKRKPILVLFTLALAIMLVAPVVTQACYRPWFSQHLHMKPIVSTYWLNKHLNHPELVIIDIRVADDYAANHIPGAINLPGGLWITNPPFGEDLPWMELPDDEYLFDLLGSAGITKRSKVVVVGSTSGIYDIPGVPPLGLYNTADITRVAMTLVYAGVNTVGVLDGGFEVWVNDGYPVTTEVPEINPVTYNGRVKASMIVDTAYVESRLGKAIIVDARDEVVYSGIVVEPWPPNPTGGHIPGARNLPTPTLWVHYLDATGTMLEYATYKDISTLREMALDVVGSRWYTRWCRKEIIVYCGVGGYASTVFFVLSEVLGYYNVKVYDGSWQAWTASGELPIE
ncbi:MAG: sulfurtransferase [Promethearchaeota archaeon]